MGVFGGGGGGIVLDNRQLVTKIETEEKRREV